jgi:transcriptional regulator with XRE-family HTH domain
MENRVRFQRQKDVEEIIRRVQEKMRQWGVTVAYLATQLGVSRQYAWQLAYYKTPISAEKARLIERTVDAVIVQRKHIRSFGEQLRAARIASGLTLKQVAEKIGYSWVGVERWEKNICRPKPGVLWHLFTVYGQTLHSMSPGMLQPGANVESQLIRPQPMQR